MYEKVSGSHELFYRYDNDGRLSFMGRIKPTEEEKTACKERLH